ncbi:hypothetical protein M8997_000180 [Phyllobacterium sp. 21LDTY02-6]|uniref:hypothetical protein n=1 Tax=Phyllobacterium sp. 21LDTY02-6 TaxID=2944903 RepID=UPI00201FF0A0|nr:hypothetical protein [Phyllobacterium sp. 21LDTY02-6]MCO4315584.1 hypothetical protein [Phyllobacterium sp. 21LDTY02-6]
MNRRDDSYPDYVRECAGAADGLGRKYGSGAALFGLLLGGLVVGDLMSRPEGINVNRAMDRAMDRGNAVEGGGGANNAVLASLDAQKARSGPLLCNL